jgi:hypothetical protein
MDVLGNFLGAAWYFQVKVTNRRIAEFTMLSQLLDPHLDPSGGMFHADVG